MRSIILAVPVALSIAGCTMADIKANEDKANAILKAVQNGARVAASVVKEGIDSVCANAADVNFVANGVRAGLGTQVGQNTSQNMRNLDTAMATLADVCARATANPNDPAIKLLLQTAMVSYNAAKAAATKAPLGS